MRQDTQPGTDGLEEPRLRGEQAGRGHFAASPGRWAVSARGLGVWFERRVALSDVDLDVSPGELLALAGANGAGKSTLLNVLATLLRPTRGRVLLFGQDAARGGPDLRRRLGVLAHQPMLYRDLSVRENLTFFARLYGLRDTRQRVATLLERLDLAGRGDDAVKTLSRGMVQRAALARALVHGPELLLADEPFSGLDGRAAGTVQKLLADLSAEGTTVVFANHDIARSLSLAGRVLVLREGRVAMEAPAAGLRPDEVEREMGTA